MTHHENHPDRPTRDEDQRDDVSPEPAPPDEALPQDPQVPSQVEPRQD